jgi:uncharacterized membrane protein YfcA
VAWKPALVMAVAAIGGGYAGPRLARRMKPAAIRGLVITVGVTMTAYFFYIAPR